VIDLSRSLCEARSHDDWIGRVADIEDVGVRVIEFQGREHEPIAHREVVDVARIQFKFDRTERLGIGQVTDVDDHQFGLGIRCPPGGVDEGAVDHKPRDLLAAESPKERKLVGIAGIQDHEPSFAHGYGGQAP
jgi:hypothetical protein